MVTISQLTPDLLLMVLRCDLLFQFSQTWTKLEKLEGAPCPVGRHSHAACCLNYGEGDPQLLVIGGVDINNQTLNDAWVLDINSARWTKVRDCMYVIEPGTICVLRLVEITHG